MTLPTKSMPNQSWNSGTIASSGSVRRNCSGRSTSRRVQRDQETASPSAVPTIPPISSPA